MKLLDLDAMVYIRTKRSWGTQENTQMNCIYGLIIGTCWSEVGGEKGELT